jgi:hypothetical protein
MGQPSAKAALALGPGIRNRVRPREVVGAGWRDGGEWSGTGAGAARVPGQGRKTLPASQRRAASWASGPDAQASGRSTAWEIVPLAGSIRGSPKGAPEGGKALGQENVASAAKSRFPKEQDPHPIELACKFGRGGMVGASPPILPLYRGPAHDCLKPPFCILCPIHPPPVREPPFRKNRLLQPGRNGASGWISLKFCENAFHLWFRLLFNDLQHKEIAQKLSNRIIYMLCL